MKKNLFWIGIVAFILISFGIVYAYDVIKGDEQVVHEEGAKPIAACKCFESSELRATRDKDTFKNQYIMSLFACQCGGVSCVVHAQAIACVK